MGASPAAGGYALGCVQGARGRFGPAVLREGPNSGPSLLSGMPFVFFVSFLGLELCEL